MRLSFDILKPAVYVFACQEYVLGGIPGIWMHSGDVDWVKVANREVDLPLYVWSPIRYGATPPYLPKHLVFWSPMLIADAVFCSYNMGNGDHILEIWKWNEKVLGSTPRHPHYVSHPLPHSEGVPWVAINGAGRRAGRRAGRHISQISQPELPWLNGELD